MKRTSGQESGQEKTGIIEKLASIDATVILAVLVVTISLLDFYSHPNGGVADLERRKALISIFGPVINSIGNYGLSASLAISAVVAKIIFNRIFHSEITQKVIKHFYLASIASIIALNALIEDFPNNNEPVRDFVMGVLGVAMGAIVAEFYAKKIGVAKNKSNN